MKIKALQAFSSSDVRCDKGDVINVSEERANWLVDNGYCAHLEASAKAAPVPTKAAPPTKPKKK